MKSNLVYIEGNQSHVIPFGHVENLQSLDIVFAVCAEEEDSKLSSAVAQAVCDVHNIWISGCSLPSHAQEGTVVRPSGSWDDDFDVLSSQLGETEYVYAYGDSQSARTGKIDREEIFYVGRGIKTRMHDHLKEAFGDKPESDELSKLERIRRESQSLCEISPSLTQMQAGQKLVHQIARFNGDYRKAKTDAVENFLISYWQGVYRLTNLTRGNTEKKSARWIVRPKVVSKGSKHWLAAINDICKEKKKTQIQQMNLLAEEISRNFDWSDIASGLVRPNRFTPLKEGFFTNGTDAHAEFVLHDSAGVRMFKVQLRLSLKKVGVCINLRPLPGEYRSFKDRIIKCFGEQAERRLGVVGSPDVYFKPFADFTKSKAKDIYFNFSDLKVKSLVAHAGWMGVPVSQKTLPEAIDLLIQRIDGELISA